MVCMEEVREEDLWGKTGATVQRSGKSNRKFNSFVFIRWKHGAKLSSHGRKSLTVFAVHPILDFDLEKNFNILTITSFVHRLDPIEKLMINWNLNIDQIMIQIYHKSRTSRWNPIKLISMT